MSGTRSILIVDPDADRRYRLGSQLEEAGYDVMRCPGPTRPEYTCQGSRSGHCPLMEDAAAVVLDLEAGDAVGMTGTSGHELLGFYRSHDRPVVVLAGTRGELGPLPDADVRLVTWPADRAEIRRSLRDLLREAPDPSRD